MQIVEWSAKIERTQEVKLRTLQSKTLPCNNRTIGNKHEDAEYLRYSRAKTQGRCRHCNEEGHWVRDCKLSLRHQSDEEENLLKMFQQLTAKHKQTLLNAVEPQGN